MTWAAYQESLDVIAECAELGIGFEHVGPRCKSQLRLCYAGGAWIEGHHSSQHGVGEEEGQSDRNVERVPLGFSELEVRKRQKSVGHCSIALVRSVGGEQQAAASAGAHQLAALNIDDVPMIICDRLGTHVAGLLVRFGRRTGGDPTQYRQ